MSSKLKYICGVVIFLCISIMALSDLHSSGDLRLNHSTVTIHNIKSGDTLAKISYKYYGDGKLYPKLADANKLKNPHFIIAGRTLIVPTIDKKPPKIESASTTIKSPIAVPRETERKMFRWRKISNSTFTVGEKLKFDIKWQFITAGTATMEINEIVKINNRNAYKIVSTAQSTPFIDTFFKVRDTNISYTDVESICSHRFDSDIQEGNFKKKETINFDQPNNTFLISDGKKGTTRPFVQDVLSSLYYTRLQNIKVGDEIVFDAHSGDKTFSLSVKVLKRETVKVPAGEFDCYKLEPTLQGEGIFKAKGKLWVWLTTDARRLPVLMKSEVFIGSVAAVLKEYQYIQSDRH